MSAAGLAARPEAAPAEVAEPFVDNPSRLLHAICPFCYPTDPPAGMPVVRWCGQTLTIKPGDLGVESLEAPPDACVICAELPTCSTCGARRTPFGVMPPTGGAAT